jgi:AcrB/AcrD/AcrF family
MNISAPFIARPIATSMLMVGLLLLGLAAYPLLPVAALPNVNYPTLSVTAQLPGADPQTIASSVATPLEEQFGQIPGLIQMTSSSALGTTAMPGSQTTPGPTGARNNAPADFAFRHRNDVGTQDEGTISR